MMKEIREINIPAKNAKVIMEMTAQQITREIVLDGQPTETFETVNHESIMMELYINGQRVDYTNMWININGQIKIGKYTLGTPEIANAIIAAYEELEDIKKEEMASWEKVLTSEEKQEIKKAEKIMKEVEKIGEENLKSYKEEKTWRRNYNNINNEGGEGFVPQRATKESYEWAKEIMERA